MSNTYGGGYVSSRKPPEAAGPRNPGFFKLIAFMLIASTLIAFTLIASTLIALTLLGFHAALPSC